MKGNENFKTHRVIGNKEYFIPEDDHPIHTHFTEGFKEASSYEEAQDCNFEIMAVYPHINKKTIARIHRPNNHTKIFTGLHYIIEVSGEVWDKLSDEVKKIVMEHETEHINVSYDRDGNPRYRLRDHDFKDFRSIVTKYGMDWFNEANEIAADLADSDDDDFIIQL
jgi:hypothetical protein